MKKQSEIEFIRNGVVQFPLAINHSNVDVDFMTGITASKLYDEHIVMEIGGDLYEFIAEKRTETNSYINEGEGISYSLDSVGDYVLRCETTDHSCHVEVKNNENHAAIEDFDPFDGRPSHVRMEYFKKQRINSGFSYSAKHHSEHEKDNNRILDIALAAYVSALGDRSYVNDWKGMDRWRYSLYREDVKGACPGEGAASYVETKVPVTHSNINTYANHISFHNPHLDMKLMLDTCDVLNEIDSCNQSKEKGNALKNKMLDLLGKFDRETQRNMVRMLKSSMYPKIESFIERNYKKVFEPKTKKEPEPCM